MKRNVFGTVIAMLMVVSSASCKSDKQEIPNTVAVSGIGTAQAQPDMARTNVSFGHTAPTTQEAKKMVEQTMEQILKILQEEKVESKDIKTLSLDYRVEYDYRSSRRVSLGQRAEQTISVTVTNLTNNPERFTSILDKIVAIDKVEVQDIGFDIEKKTELFRQSRELAYQKALEKAQQYAELCGRKLGKVLTISENISQDVAQRYNLKQMNNVVREEVADLSSEGSFLPTGEQSVTSEINVVFSLE